MSSSCTDLQSNIRETCRDQAREHRKAERSKLLTSKRPILEGDAHKFDPIHLSEVEALSKCLKREGDIEILKKLKTTFSQGDKYISAFLRVNGALASLVSLLLSKDANVAVEVAKCLTNMATGNHKTAQTLIKTAAPYLITFLNGSNTTLQSQSAWALGNLAADCQNCRERLKSQGLLQSLLHLLNVKNQNSLESCTFALSVYTKLDTGSNRFLCEEGILQTLSLLVEDAETSSSTQFNIYCILFHLSFPISEVEEYFVASGIIQKITAKWIRLCSSSPLDILLVTPLLRCIGNLCAGSCSSVRTIGSHVQFVDACVHLLFSPHLHLRKETLWMLTNWANSSHLDDLEKIMFHMNRVLSENLQVNISVQALKFILSAKRRFEEEGRSGISIELNSTLQKIQNLNSSVCLQLGNKSVI